MNFIRFIPKQILVVISILLGILIVLFFLVLNKPSQPQPEIPKQLPFQTTSIGQTTKDIEAKLPVKNKKVFSATGQIDYEVQSTNPFRPNKIVAKDEKAAFESIILPEVKTDIPFSRISEVKKTFGEPNKDYVGSFYYGPFVSTFVYADKGFAIIGNSNTDEVYEIQQFIPTALENYVKLYGEDITNFKKIDDAHF